MSYKTFHLLEKLASEDRFSPDLPLVVQHMSEPSVYQDSICCGTYAYDEGYEGVINQYDILHGWHSENMMVFRVCNMTILWLDSLARIILKTFRWMKSLVVGFPFLSW